jgi:hypothetical protein
MGRDKIMGHYDEQREEHEKADLKKRAWLSCRSVQDQEEYENVFVPAKKIYDEHVRIAQGLEKYHDLKHKYL